jgi:phosphoribosylformimino-5-aminoimidazole carboxamide ribotide isomerase
VIVAPAVDLKGGRCVQLVGGRPDDERVSLPDAVAVAERWWALGFRALHVIDLDAALGSGHNRDLVGEVLRATPAETQVGGGLRDQAAVEATLEAGADRVVVGTRAVDDSGWLRHLALSFPGRVLVAADVRGAHVLRKGWTEESLLTLEALLARLEEHPLAGVLCTDVAREGRMEGIDAERAARAVAACAHPMWISGGVTSLRDLETLEAAGAAGAVLGMALYTGKLDAAHVARRFGQGGAAPSGASSSSASTTPSPTSGASASSAPATRASPTGAKHTA